MNKDLKVIVAHPGKQHSYLVASALKKYGLLFKYATTVYDKESSLKMKIVKSLIDKENRNRASARKNPDLNDTDVVQFCEFLSLLLLLVNRIDKKRLYVNKLTEYISRRFQRKLAQYIIDNKVDVVVSYDTNSTVLFSILKDKAPNVVRIMDNAHPNRHYLYKVYNENLNRCGDFKFTFNACGYILNSEIAKAFGEEVKLADAHIVASTFSKNALLYEGIDQSCIYLVKYALKPSVFVVPNRRYDNNELQIMFLGEVNQRKGIYQVLEAARIINNPKIVFNIIGSGSEYHKELYEPYKHFVKIHGRVPFEVLQELKSSNHLFVFPSMGEGFGFALLEGMAAGMPAITTRYCAGADFIRDGENGFLIDSCDTDALVDKIQWCYNNLDKLEAMGNEARKAAQTLTLGKYQEGIYNTVISAYENKIRRL